MYCSLCKYQLFVILAFHIWLSNLFIEFVGKWHILVILFLCKWYGTNFIWKSGKWCYAVYLLSSIFNGVLLFCRIFFVRRMSSSLLSVFSWTDIGHFSYISSTQQYADYSPDIVLVSRLPFQLPSDLVHKLARNPRVCSISLQVFLF